MTMMTMTALIFFNTFQTLYISIYEKNYFFRTNICPKDSFFFLLLLPLCYTFLISRGPKFDSIAPQKV